MNSLLVTVKTAASLRNELRGMSKLKIASLCFLTDLGLSLWSYFKLTNYDEYLKAVRPMLASPDFQLQIYQVLLQSLTFSIILFLSFHLVVYYLFAKEKKWAMKYVRFYSLLAALSCLVMVATQIWAGIIPMLIYGYVFTKTRPMSQNASP